MEKVPSKAVVEALHTRWDDGYGRKSTLNRTWQECTDYVLPTRQSFGYQRGENQALPQVMYDSTAVWANTQLASGLHSFLTSPTQRWFKMDLTDEDKRKIGEVYEEEVEAWLQDVTDVMYGIFNSQKTNFAPQAHELYLDLGALGTGVLYVEEDTGNIPMRFVTFHLADCVLEEDAYGRINACHRRFKLRGRNLLEMFEELLPADIKKKAMDRPGDQFECQHSIFPRGEPLPDTPTFKGMPYASVYFLLDGKVPLREGGYREFPIMAPRWSKLVGEVYGRSPAMLAMPDIRMVNAMSKNLIEGAQLAVRPPLQLPDEGFLLPIKMTPGGLNFFNSSLGSDQRITPIEMRSNFQIGHDIIESRRQQIVRSFYVDWMQLQEGPQMTATEVMQRTENNMRMMAPSVSRLNFEWLDPLIDRVYAIAWRKKMFPPPPKMMEGLNIRPQYVSPVAKAQRVTQVMGFQRMMETLTPLAQIKPEILDRLDADGVVDFIADVNDVAHKILLPMEEVMKIREARAKAAKEGAQSQQMDMGADTLLKGAQAAKTMAETAQPMQ